MAEVIDIGRVRGQHKAPPMQFRRGSPPQPKRTIPERDIPAGRNGRPLFQPFQMENLTLPKDWRLEELGIMAIGEDVLEADRVLVKQYKEYPLRFLRYELGIPGDVWAKDCPPVGWRPPADGRMPLWSKEREIIEALVKYRRVAVPAGQGVSKTHVMSLCAIYLPFVWLASGYTTAPTFRQVKNLLWEEIRKQWAAAEMWRARSGKEPMAGKLLQTRLELGDKWFVDGFATDRPEHQMVGLHSEATFFFGDEACGLTNEVMEAKEAILTGADTFELLCGNPVDPLSKFAECCKPNSDYYVVPISCYDSPNVRNKRIIFPAMTTLDWCLRRKRRWGSSHPLYIARVTGKFPDMGEDKLISLSSINAALERGKALVEAGQHEGRVTSIGLDIARKGSDRTVCTYRREVPGHDGWIFYDVIWTEGKSLTTGVATRVLLDQSKNVWPSLPGADEDEGGYIPPINLDDIGVGGGVTDILLDHDDEPPVNPINVGEKSFVFADEEARIGFKNLRAEYYWKLAKEFEEGRACLIDEDLAHELAVVPVIFKMSLIQVGAKDDMKKVLSVSPDHADSAMLACSIQGLDDDDSEEVGGWL